MSFSELTLVILAPLGAALLTLWLRSKSAREGTLLWPVGFAVLAAASVFVARSIGQRDLAGALLLCLCPFVTALLAICPAAIRRRPWALFTTVPLLYLLALLVAINIGLETSLLSL